MLTLMIVCIGRPIILVVQKTFVIRDAICIYLWSTNKPFENRIFKFQILSQLKFVNGYTTLVFYADLLFYSSDEEWNMYINMSG